MSLVFVIVHLSFSIAKVNSRHSIVNWHSMEIAFSCSHCGSDHEAIWNAATNNNNEKKKDLAGFLFHENNELSTHAQIWRQHKISFNFFPLPFILHWYVFFLSHQIIAFILFWILLHYNVRHFNRDSVPFDRFVCCVPRHRIA